MGKVGSPLGWDSQACAEINNCPCRYTVTQYTVHTHIKAHTKRTPTHTHIHTKAHRNAHTNTPMHTKYRQYTHAHTQRYANTHIGKQTHIHKQTNSIPHIRQELAYNLRQRNRTEFPHKTFINGPKRKADSLCPSRNCHGSFRNRHYS